MAQVRGLPLRGQWLLTQREGEIMSEPAHMSELVVVAFDRPDDAARALEGLQQLQREYRVDLEHTAIAVRSNGRLRISRCVPHGGARTSTEAAADGVWRALAALWWLNPMTGFTAGLAQGQDRPRSARTGGSGAKVRQLKEVKPKARLASTRRRV